MTIEEQNLFMCLFDNPLNKYVENIRQLQPGGLFMESRLIKTCIALSDAQDKFLDEMDMKYF